MATGNETIVLTRKIDMRQDVHYPVWEIVATATFDADDTGNVTLTCAINGTIRDVLLLVPTFTNGSETGQVQIKDNDSNIIYDSGEVADASLNHSDVIHPVTGTISIVMGVSGVIGTIDVTHTGIMKVWIRGD